jgi:hypothetical protein
MPPTGMPVVFRIVDNETRLLERADQKAISLLSILGVFMVFFIVYYRLLPINVFTLALVTLYFGLALFGIWNLVLVVRPRVRSSGGATGNKSAPDPTFFHGICGFQDFGQYRKALEELVGSDERTLDVYARQIFALARINEAKYKHVQRGVTCVIGALTTELLLIVYLFASHAGKGRMPPLG